MWSMYFIQHTSGELYYGVTNNLKRRIEEHNRSGKKYTTRPSGSWSLIYAEAYVDERDAYTREARIKHHGRAKQEILRRLKNYLSPKSGAG